LEEGYIKLKPYRPRSSSDTAGPSEAVKNSNSEATPPSQSQLVPSTPQSYGCSSPRSETPSRPGTPISESIKKELTWKLLGSYLGKYIVYVDSTTAWLLSDDIPGKITSSLFQTLTAGGHMGGTRLTRGYIEPPKKSANKPNSSTNIEAADKNPSTATESREAAMSAKITKDQETINRAVVISEAKEMEYDHDSSDAEDRPR
jgi:hypothetical protein